MDAKNLKVVFLSGTPMINNPFEVGALFNLLRGPIISYKFRMRPSPSSTKYPKLEKMLKEHSSYVKTVLEKRIEEGKLTLAEGETVEDLSVVEVPIGYGYSMVVNAKFGEPYLEIGTKKFCRECYRFDFKTRKVSYKLHKTGEDLTFDTAAMVDDRS